MLKAKTLKENFYDFNWLKILNVFLIATIIFSAIASIVSFYRYYSLRQNIINTVYEKVKKETVVAAGQVDEFLKQLPKLVHSLAVELSEKKLTQEELIEKLKKKPDSVIGFGVAYAPFAFEKNKKLFAPYYVERGAAGANELVYLENFYDYTLPQFDFYFQAMHKGAGFRQSFKDSATGDIVTSYSEPFYDSKLNKIGVVFANLSRNQFRSLTNNMDLRSFGYAFIMNDKGTIITHPNSEIALNFKTIFDLAIEEKNPKEEVAAKKVINGESAFQDYNISTTTGQTSVVFYEPIKTAGWSLATVLMNDEIGLESNEPLRTKQIWVILFSIILLFLCSIFFMFYNRDFKVLLGISSFICTLVGFFGIFFMWKIAFVSLYASSHEKEKPITDKSQLNNIIQKYAKQGETKSQEYVITPVGLDLHYLSVNNTTAKFIGHFWQRIGLDQKITKGIDFPSVDVKSIKQAYDFPVKDTAVVGWQIDGEITQKLIDKYYPFNNPIIKLIFWPAEFNSKMILVPDLDAYKVIMQSANLGIDTRVNLISFPYWRLKGTYFTLEKPDYRTNFGNYYNAKYGVVDNSKKSDLPELIFNIVLEATFSNAALIDLIPIMVILIVLFSMLFLLNNNSFSSFLQIISMGASLLFATLFFHLRFKSMVVTEEIVFFEYLYYVLYFSIIAISIFVIISKDKPNRSLVIPIAAFWPTIMVIIFALSVITFH